MGFTIGAGLPAKRLSSWLKDAAKKYGCFDDGRVNYTHADIAPTVMCTITYKDEILLVKRGFGLADAEGYWSTVNGFIDEIKPVKQIVKQELKEELGVVIDNRAIKVGASYTLHNPKEKRRYIVFPCRVSLQTKPKIVLDVEHTDYTWIHRNTLESYDILDDLPYAVDAALKL